MTEESVQTSAQTESSEAVLRLLTQMVEDAPNLQAIVVGYVRKDGAAAVRYTPMSTAMLSHLSRIFSLKVDREYMAGMVTGPGMRGPSVRQAVASSLRGAQNSPAQRLQEREKARNTSKAKKGD